MITFKTLAASTKSVIKSIAGAKYRASIERSWHFNDADFHSFQESHFRSIYNWARTSVPYYTQRPKDYPELNAQQNVYKFLQELPLLPKHTVRDHNTCL